jgi:nucleoside phosphorylase
MGSDGFAHPIILALGDMGESLAAAHSARLLSHFRSIRTLIMAGIAGGCPKPEKPEDHIRLGDIVVSDRYGVVQFDFVKRGSDSVTFRAAPRPPSSRLLHFARHLRAREPEGECPWETHLDKGLRSLGWSRPDDSRDILGEVTDSTKHIGHPTDPKRRAGQPRVFLGLIASSNTLLKDAVLRDELRNKFGAKAIEMETAGLADAAWLDEIGYLGVRGICDYCDNNKNDEWQNYAAMAAATYTRALLESVPGASTIKGGTGHGLATPHTAARPAQSFTGVVEVVVDSTIWRGRLHTGEVLDTKPFCPRHHVPLKPRTFADADWRCTQKDCDYHRLMPDLSSLDVVVKIAYLKHVHDEIEQRVRQGEGYIACDDDAALYV